MLILFSDHSLLFIIQHNSSGRTTGTEETIEEFECRDLDNIVMPIKSDVLEAMLTEAQYPPDKLRTLIHSFRHGFDIGYRGPQNRQDYSLNIPIKPGVGSLTEMWNKIMKEVKLERYAGPFDEVPYKNFMQSPIGLVPKDRDKTRLIFHLSYNFRRKNREDGLSLNEHTPESLSKVKYKDLDHAIKTCLKIQNQMEAGVFGKIYILTEDERLEGMKFAKADVVSAFHIMPVFLGHRCWLIMKIKHAKTGKTCYFVDKCLPFGASFSCAVFQSFSDVLAHLTEYEATRLHVAFTVIITNYLDDFLFIAISARICNSLLNIFIDICQMDGCPVSEEKTEHAESLMVFLGMLLNGICMTISIPEDKIVKAINMIDLVLSKCKITIKSVQKLTGNLNFLSRAIVPGRTFTRCMYNKLKLWAKDGKLLKAHHHIHVDQEFV